MKNKRLLPLLFTCIGVALLIGRDSAGIQPPTAPNSATTRAELTDRMKSLELRVQTLEQEHADATTLQTEYRAFYEKAFNTQINMVWAIGILITVMLAVAGRLGFGAFEKHTEAVIKIADTEFRAFVEKRISAEAQALAEKSQKQVSNAIERLTEEFRAKVTAIELKSEATHLVETGATYMSLKQYDDAVGRFREYVQLYASQGGLTVISKQDCLSVIRNLFIGLHDKDPDRFLEVAEKESSGSLYEQLREEVILAANESEVLSGALFKIGWKPAPNK